MKTTPMNKTTLLNVWNLRQNGRQESYKISSMKKLGIAMNVQRRIQSSKKTIAFFPNFPTKEIIQAIYLRLYLFSYNCTCAKVSHTYLALLVRNTRIMALHTHLVFWQKFKSNNKKYRVGSSRIKALNTVISLFCVITVQNCFAVLTSWLTDFFLTLHVLNFLSD